MSTPGHPHYTDVSSLREGFLPFARPDYIEGMVLGNDLDSLLSALFLHERYGWPVTGFYCDYQHLYCDTARSDFRERLSQGRYIAVDLDICDLRIPSLGHHILALDAEDQIAGHTHTLNPNLMQGLAVNHRYGAKYPLSTLHYLRFLFQDPERSAAFEFLNWLSDSSFLNAQHYADNVANWVNHQVPLAAFSRWLPLLGLPYFEEKLHETILTPLSKHPGCRPGRSAYKSKHLGISGYQAQFKDPNRPEQSLQTLLDLLADLSQMPRLVLPDHFDLAAEGTRHILPVSALPAGDFAAWIEQQQVFSYAFVFKDTLNYTVLDL
jgi:hypothetical protein